MKTRLLAPLATACALAAPAVAAPVKGEIKPDGVQVTEAGRPVLFYRTAPAAGAEPWRSNFVHPLQAPDGTVLTEDRPADHLHQRGVFWAWRRILKGGVQVGDTWVMKDVVFEPTSTVFETLPDGRGRLRITADWVSTAGGGRSVLFGEETVVLVHSLKDGGRVLAFDTTLHARQPGLALAGTDDEKEYSGFSVRFVNNDRLSFTSDGQAVEPTNAVLPAGEAMTFAWPDEAGLPDWKVTLACQADGAPVKKWVLRRELSMQTCAFPGRTLSAVPVDKPLRLHATLTIAPAG